MWDFLERCLELFYNTYFYLYKKYARISEDDWQLFGPLENSPENASF